MSNTAKTILAILAVIIIIVIIVAVTGNKTAAPLDTATMQSTSQETTASSTRSGQTASVDSDISTIGTQMNGMQSDTVAVDTMTK
jgi:uncharacterized protein YpmS